VFGDPWGWFMACAAVGIACLWPALVLLSAVNAIDCVCRRAAGVARRMWRGATGRDEVLADAAWWQRSRDAWGAWA